MKIIMSSLLLDWYVFLGILWDTGGVLPDVPPFVGSDQAILGEVTTIGSGTTQGMARGGLGV